MTASDGTSGRDAGGPSSQGSDPQPASPHLGAGQGDPSDEREDRGAELMLRWQGGDEAAFAELVHVYSPQVFSLLTRFLGRAHSGREDMVQEVFMRVLGAKDRYEPTARFSTWLYSITWRLCANESQRRSIRRASSLDDRDGGGAAARQIADEATPEPEAAMENADLVEAVRAAIASLPENQRVAVVLARYHGMPYVEIAAVIDSTEKAVKSLIHRARATLREILQPVMEEEIA